MAMDIKARLAKGNKCYYALKNTVKSKNIWRSLKLNIYSIIIRPTIVYASETLEEKMIITWESKILRRIFWPKKEDGIWNIRTDKQLRELHNSTDIVAEIRSRKLLSWDT
jgi:predicted ATP-dependent endonuclease of OLD family